MQNVQIHQQDFKNEYKIWKIKNFKYATENMVLIIQFLEKINKFKFSLNSVDPQNETHTAARTSWLIDSFIKWKFIANYFDNHLIVSVQHLLVPAS